MFDRFTDRARKVMDLARQAAVVHGHEYIDTPHILHGLYHEEGSGIAATVLKELVPRASHFKDGFRRMASAGKAVPSEAILPFTPNAKWILERAAQEALDLSHTYIGTEHLLLAVERREREGRARGETGMLAYLGVLVEVRAEVLEILGVSEDKKLCVVCQKSYTVKGTNFCLSHIPHDEFGGAHLSGRTGRTGRGGETNAVGTMKPASVTDAANYVCATCNRRIDLSQEAMYSMKGGRSPSCQCVFCPGCYEKARADDTQFICPHRGGKHYMEQDADNFAKEVAALGATEFMEEAIRAFDPSYMDYLLSKYLFERPVAFSTGGFDKDISRLVQTPKSKGSYRMRHMIITSLKTGFAGARRVPSFSSTLRDAAQVVQKMGWALLVTDYEVCVYFPEEGKSRVDAANPMAGGPHVAGFLKSDDESERTLSRWIAHAALLELNKEDKINWKEEGLA